MRVYFSADLSANKNLQKHFIEIIDSLHNAGVSVLSNVDYKKVSEFSPQELEKIHMSGQSMINAVDGLIVEDSNQLAEHGFLVASALAHKKPILYLTPKNKSIDKNLLQISKNEPAKSLLNLKDYTPDTLKNLLLEFIGNTESPEGRKEKASIKFTLRITKKIERYLQWKTNNINLSKADYLRDEIQRLMESDKEYEKFNITHQK